MASLEKRGDSFRIVFRYGGQKYRHELKTGNEREANALLGRLEDNLILLERGKIDPPADGNLALFLLSDGKLSDKPKVEISLPLSMFFRRYREEYPTAAKESNTRYTEGVHMRHLERIIGSRTGVRLITAEMLQRYVNQRSKEEGRNGEPLSHATVKKEIGSLASIWNKWGVQAGLVSGPAPTKGLIYAKTRIDQPFQTWEQIEQRIKRGGLSVAEQDELWESLFLSIAQVEKLLAHVKKTARFGFVYAMFAFAAYAGCRRSEALRSEIDDVDFGSGMVRIREKKKDNTKAFTFRFVPLAPPLATAMRDWFDHHPGGRMLVCEQPNVPVTPQMAAHYFRWAVEGSKWDVLRGWHVLRHSFISNCARKGVDQRMIDTWVGHTTTEMAARYRHLFPEPQLKAMKLVFGA
ncbi:MAG: site-specific integrase [Tepidisphaeraceae bacterium]